MWQASLVAVVFLFGLATSLYKMSDWFGPGEETSVPGIGKPAPRIDLVHLSGDEPLATANVPLEGRVTLLHFWGTWCGACLMEFPELAAASEGLAENPHFGFVPITCDSGSGDTFDGLSRNTNDYFQRQHISPTAYADLRGVTRRSVAQRIKRERIWYPSSVLIGPDGKIVGFWEGYSDEFVPEITRKAQALLSSL